jgi:endo-1,4-beta-xylanase
MLEVAVADEVGVDHMAGPLDCVAVAVDTSPMVTRLRQEGVPIDGVGVQTHLDIQYPFPDTMGQNVQRFAALGLDVAITEADVRVNLPATAAELATQASYYKQAMQACLAVRRCISYTVWGFTDAHSWVPSFFAGEGAACLYDENLQPKPAYFAVRQALAAARAAA